MAEIHSKRAEKEVKVLVLGGVGSGKSEFALKLARQLPAPRVFLATAEPLDEEMRLKIEVHRRERRGLFEKTVEEPVRVPEVLKTLSGTTVVFECLTTWISNLLYRGLDAERLSEELLETLKTFRGNLVVVSNEVGLGIIPFDETVRRYSRILARLNREVSLMSDRVYLVVAGNPLPLKGPRSPELLL